MTSASRPSALTRPWLAVLAAALAVQAAIAALGLPGAERPLLGDEAMYVDLAEAWAAGRPAELDPLWPPGFPAALAAWIAVFGGWRSFMVLQIAALIVAAATLGRLALAVTGEPRVAVLAAGLLVCDPQVAAFASTYRPEALHLAASLLVFDLALLRSPRLATGLALGATMAASALLKSVLTPFLPLLVLAFVRRAPRPARLPVLVAALGVCLALLGPVLAHNYRRHGIVSIGDSAAFNLLLGLTDESPRSLVGDRAATVYHEYLAGGATVRERRDALLDRLRALVEERGLLRLAAAQLPRQYFRLFDRESYFSAMLPGGSVATAGAGYRDPPRWLASALLGLGLTIYGVLLGAAPTGLAQLLRARRPGILWALAWLVYLLGLFFFLHVKARYRLVLLPVLALGAARALVRRGSPDAPAASPLPLGWRLVAAALGGVLLVFAFGAAPV